MRRTSLRLLLGLLLAAAPVTLNLTAQPSKHAEPVTVLAAASLTHALHAVANDWSARGNAPPRLVFAASSTLARQIEAGAPADIYAAANLQWMDRLQERGLIEAESRITPIGNSLALISRRLPAAPPHELNAQSDLPGMLAPGERLAIGDPAHVPAGIYARQALETLGWWPALEDRLALGGDVRAVVALVGSREVPFGIVYATDVQIMSSMQKLATFPAESHDEIAYPFAILKDSATPATRAFFAFLTGPEGRAIFAQFGFTPAPDS